MGLCQAARGDAECGATRRHRRGLAASGRSTFRDKEQLATVNTSIRAILDSTGVYSMSAKCDDVLMWSHYADCHRGICLRFKAASPFFGRAQPVIYQADRPTLNPFRDTHIKSANKALLTKADFWRYEEEYRIVDHEQGPGVRKFSAHLLDGVILGARISAENRARIFDWSKQRSAPTDVLEARMHPTKFRVEITSPAPG